MQRPTGATCGMTLRHRYDEVGLPCWNTMGSPSPISTYAMRRPSASTVFFSCALLEIMSSASNAIVHRSGKPFRTVVDEALRAGSFRACPPGAGPPWDTRSLNFPEVVVQKHLQALDLVVDPAHVLLGKRSRLHRGAGVGTVDDADDGGKRCVQAHPVVQAGGVGVLAGKDQRGLDLRERLA